MKSTLEEVNNFAATRIAAAARLEFKRIPEHPDYFVSNRGHVISAKRKKLKISKLQVSVDGYHRVNINPGLGKKSLFVRVPRLVLEAFFGSAENGMQAMHRNGIRWDDRPENLSWGTAKDNAADRTRHGTQVGVNHPRAKLTEDQVYKIRQSKESDRKLSRDFKISKGMIYYIRHRKSWVHLP